MILIFKNLYPDKPEYNKGYTIRSDFFEQRVKVFIKSEPNLNNGFYESESGLYEVPWTYIGFRNINNLNDIFSEDIDIIKAYLEIFEKGFNKEIVFGFLPPEYFRDKLNIPYSEKTKSDMFAVSKKNLDDLELQTSIKPSDLRYRKRDLILPEIIKNYKVYKIPGKYTYLGEDDYNNNNNYYDYIKTETIPS